jgi:ATP-dependent DNA ligase
MRRWSFWAPVLAPLRAPAPPPGMPRRHGIHWAQPGLRVEVAAAARDAAGRLRQARFIRVRTDLM